MSDQRKIKRTAILKSARIVICGLRRPIDCVVCDITNAGAGLRIMPDAHAPLPNYFELMFDSASVMRRCEVRWRNNERLGVIFRPL
jgi:PilZ domain